MIKDQMEKIYSTIPLHEIPWNREAPPDVLRDLVESEKIRPCRAVELGCGAGNYVMYLASRGFDATGIDVSETAIEIAEKRASAKGLNCTFLAADVLGDMGECEKAFDFVYDWQLLHHIFPPEREKYINNVHRLLKPDGWYLSVCFSEDSLQFGGKGKYRKTPLDTVLYFSSEGELATLFGSLFEIEALKTIDIEAKSGVHKAIYAFLRKR